MQRTQQIINILQTDYIGYSNLRHAYFMDWCRGQCERHYLPLKVLAMHDNVVQWYETEWNYLVEQQVFQGLEDLIPYMQPTDLLNFIDIHAREILKFYPSILFEKIRKTLKISNELKPKAI